MTPLLLIQGLLLDHHGWDSAEGDVDDRPVVVMNHRGTGASDDHFPGDWSMSGFARGAVSVLDVAGHPASDGLRHSMGGCVAQWLGALYPGRVAALVLGSAAVGDETGVARPQHATDALNSGDGARLSRALLHRCLVGRASGHRDIGAPVPIPVLRRRDGRPAACPRRR